MSINHYSLEALWTLRDSKLMNKARLWSSDDDYVFEERGSEERGSLISIRNITKNKVLAPSIIGNVIFEDFCERKPHQLWIKENVDGKFFTLKSNESFKYLTAISGNRLDVKGKNCQYKY